MNTPCIIRGLGHCVPDTVLTNADLERMVETNDEWIISRTGIRERRVALKGETCVDLCQAAAQKALVHAGMQAEELTHVLVATFSPDAFIPSAACMLSHRLGISGRMSMDISAACSGFLYGVETARALLALHPQAKILMAACDVLSSRVDYTDRTTCVLFGDGAGAVVLTADAPNGPCPQVLDVLVASDGAMGDLLTIKGGGSATPYKLGDTIRSDFFVQMNGATAKKLGVANGNKVSLSGAGSELKARVHVNEGVAANTAAMLLGFGRSAWDEFTKGKGDNVYKILTVSDEAGTGLKVWAGSTVTVAKV